MKKLVNKINETLIKTKETVNQLSLKAKVGIMSGALVTSVASAFCANELEGLVNKVGTLAFGVLELVGAIMLVLGIVALVKTMTGDDDNGADQNGTSKAIKKIIAGAVMCFGPLLVLGWIGAKPTELGTKFFGGL